MGEKFVAAENQAGKKGDSDDGGEHNTIIVDSIW